ncbi:MAG: beta-galactosidase [Planctomycetota bacterium]
MPIVSFDSRSLSIEGRRIWVVGGTIHYARLLREQWHDTLRAAREAGLNTVEAPVVWGQHEQRPGEFDFTGDLDLKAFVQAAAKEGLFCILRLGPYIGGDYDFGGLPAYLHGVADKKNNRVKFREDEPLYLEAVDRYYRAIMEQVGGLQVAQQGPTGSSAYAYPPGGAAGGYQGEGGGPLLMVQVEHAWESTDPEQLYLNRLVSMLRQHGCVVPLFNANNLWQPVEGTFDTWRGEADLPAMMRQLSVVQPESPPIVSHFKTTKRVAWGLDTPAPIDSDALAYRIAGLVGVGAQFNLAPFYSGTNLGFGGSGPPRLGEGEPLGEAGQRGDTYRAVKRVCTFASQFGSILANSEPISATTIALNETDHPVAVLHQQSTQGELVMLLKSGKDKTKQTELMLGSGLTLEVPHAGQRVAWVLLNTSLGGRSVLDYTSLSPWALMDRKLLVVFGPAGSTGQVSIDGEHHTVTVPTGKSPTVIQGDPFHIAVLNQEQIDSAYRSSDGLIIGCNGIDGDGKPKPLKGWGTQFTVGTDGVVTRKRIAAPTTPTAPRLTPWRTLSVRSLVDGSDADYQPIDGPASLGELGQAYGYGWYRFSNKKAVTGKVLPHAGGDRLHLYQQGKLAGLLGTGEGAEHNAKQLKLAGDTVVLADCLGRSSGGPALGTDPKGLPDHLYTVKAIKTGKPVVARQPAGDPFRVVGMAYRQRAGARPMSESLTWSIKPEPRKPVLLEIDGLAQPCVIRVNEAPIGYYTAEPAGQVTRLLLDPAELEAMTGGKNSVGLELLEPLGSGVKIEKHVRFYQTAGTATPKEGWAFAPWTIPTHDDAGWRDVPKALPSQPGWFCAAFDIESSDAALYLEPNGMSKGQIVLNGHNVSRYWQQTREGRIVGPQERYLLPAPWLKVDESNSLMLFDEHGRTPDKCKLVYEVG